MPRLFLASSSPRRRELLEQIGVPFERVSASIDETPQPGEDGAAYVQRLALEKARAGLAQLDAADAVVLGADTSVLLGERILGKPGDRQEGLQMLAALSGRTHRVLTAVALVSRQASELRLVESLVQMRPISTAEAEAYWDSGEPQDKAGGYAIQGLGAVFVRRLEGSYTGVVGLPLCETAELLAAFDIPCWRTSAR